MEREFVPYELAVKLKALGFNEPCFGCFNHLDKSEIWTNRTYTNGLTENITAPTFSQAFRWFREKYGDLLRYDWGEVPHFLMIQIEMTKGKTYEEAELTCLTKLIEIVEQPKN